jgi:hypothetical protein
MGRQIHFHMLPDDQKAFLRFVQERDPIVVAIRDSDSKNVQPVTDFDTGPDKTLCLWNPSFLPHLERKWIPDPGYYRLDEFGMPILEFTSSFKATWEEKPALGQGRLYGIFNGKPPDFEKWYEALVRWIRTNYQKNPRGTGGYVGPAAYEFYKSGGYLLPNFLPPRTKVWLTEIGKQHVRSRTSRQPRRAKARP